MKKKISCLLAFALALSLLCGCGDFSDYLGSQEDSWNSENLVAFQDMAYERPDMVEFRQVLEESCRLAREETDLDTVVNGIYAFYDVYDRFYTNYYLADIWYCMDLTDLYWEEEYNYCAAQTATAEAGLEELFYTLADSPIRDQLEGPDYFGEGYFDAYEGESMWDEQFIAMMEQESQLIARYYELSNQEGSYAQRLQLLVDLVALRQNIAAYAGYPDYVQFAYDFYYYRDFTPDQVTAYLESLRGNLVELYVNLEPVTWEGAWYNVPESHTMAYLRSCALAMGGMVHEAFTVLEKNGLYDISYGANKYPASFEVYLPSYYEPFIFMNPAGTVHDKLTLVHEFGHFANEYACYGSYAGIDVAEIYSQAMEYLSLLYARGGDSLTRLKMEDSLCVFVEQSAFAAFEHQLYGLTGDALTAENVQSLFTQVCADYGFESFEWDPEFLVEINHFYTNPMYVISYVISNDAALQLYQLELEQSGQGLALYNESLMSTEGYFLSFLDSLGLQSPFTPGRMEEVRGTLEDILK